MAVQAMSLYQDNAALLVWLGHLPGFSQLDYVPCRCRAHEFLDITCNLSMTEAATNRCAFSHRNGSSVVIVIRFQNPVSLGHGQNRASIV